MTDIKTYKQIFDKNVVDFIALLLVHKKCNYDIRALEIWFNLIQKLIKQHLILVHCVILHFICFIFIFLYYYYNMK